MDFLHFIFSGVCHQEAGRALGATGSDMPLCARCAGMYIGFLGGLSFFVMAAFFDRSVKSCVAVALACVAAALWAADGAANLFGFIATPGWARFATGMLLSVSLSPFMANLFLATFERRAARRVPGGAAAIAIIAAVVVAAAANLRPAPWLLRAQTWTAAGGLAAFLLVVHSALLRLVLGGGRLRLACALSFVTVAAQVTALGLLRSVAGI